MKMDKNQGVHELSSKLEQKNDVVQTSFFSPARSEKKLSVPARTKSKATPLTAQQAIDGLQMAHDMAIEIYECAECIIMEMFERLDDTKSHIRNAFDSDRILHDLTALDIALDYLCKNFSLDREPLEIDQPKTEQLELIAS